MIQHIDIASVQKDLKVDADLAKYIQKKIGKLDKIVRKHDRSSLRADVKLKEQMKGSSKKCTCEVVLHTPGAVITASESTINMYAAVDIVEQKIKNQLLRHKEKQQLQKTPHTARAKRVLAKIFSKN